MGFRDEFRGTGMTFGDWSQLQTTSSGLRTNEERLTELKRAVSNSFKRGIDRVVESHRADAEGLRNELEYQSAMICDEISRGTDDIVTTIQSLSDYLGMGFRRYAGPSKSKPASPNRFWIPS